MQREFGRRAVLATAGGTLLGALGVSTTSDRSRAAPSTETFSILPDTDHETTGYVQTGTADGPTILLVGGIHGNETAGYEAAAQLTDRSIDRGRLVTVPRANAVAIEKGTRYGEDGVDLNRQFPVGQQPTTELARALWGVVERVEPDLVIDLHESKSLYEGDVTDGVGQAIFHSNDPAARTDARETVAYLNANAVADERYNYTAAPFSDEDGALSGLFVHKAARDTDSVAFLAETVFDGPSLSTRTQWHTATVRQLTADALIEDTDQDESANEPANEAPSAAIETTPRDAESIDFSKGDTVRLDAAPSTDPDGEITHFEWDTTGDGDFDDAGEQIEVTLAECGTYPITLRVTDDEGATATTDVVLSTV